MGPASIAPPPAPSAAGAEASTDDAKGEGAAQDLGEIRTIVVKPPIVVRDLATELGVKPFKLISELMEMGIFASINQSLEEDVASKLAEKRGIILEIRHRGEGPKAKKKKEVKEVDESLSLKKDRLWFASWGTLITEKLRCSTISERKASFPRKRVESLSI